MCKSFGGIDEKKMRRTSRQEDELRTVKPHTMGTDYYVHDQSKINLNATCFTILLVQQQGINNVNHTIRRIIVHTDNLSSIGATGSR